MTRLVEIDGVSDDPEKAHVWENELWKDTLVYIKLHSSDPVAAEMASLALKSEEIVFDRWFA